MRSAATLWDNDKPLSTTFAGTPWIGAPDRVQHRIWADTHLGAGTAVLAVARPAIAIAAERSSDAGSAGAACVAEALVSLAESASESDGRSAVRAVPGRRAPRMTS
jgi:hypothetical protein